MKHATLLLALVVLVSLTPHASAGWWELRESLPADIQQLQKENRRDEVAGRVRNHLATFESLPEKTALALFYTLASDPGTDFADFLHKYHPRLIKHPVLCLESALMLLHADSSGYMQDGRFVRGRDPANAAVTASSYSRNRWQALNLVLAVRDAMPAAAPVELRAQMLSALAEVLSGDAPSDRWGASRSWWLLKLTDLHTKPEIEIIRSRGYEWQPPPAGDDPTRWFFAIPASFESAKTDGERWRWALAQLSVLGGKSRTDAASRIASVMRRVFSASGLPGLSGEAPIVGLYPPPDPPETALHTLDDGETIVMSGGKLRRLRLPEDLAFIPRLKEIALDVTADNQMRAFALECLFYEWRTRWQYDRLTSFLKTLPQPPDVGKSGMDMTGWTKSIEAPQLRFESLPAQLAGPPARLRLMFRNVTQARFTAQVVDMRKIIADIDANVKRPVADEKGQISWKSWALEGLHERLTAKDAARWLQGDPIQWTADLESAPHHWDRQIEITSPLTQAGVYLITCDAGMEKPAQTLLWLDELMVVTVPQQEMIDRSHATRDPFGGYKPPPRRFSRHIVLETATGRPVPNARLLITGGHSSSSETRDLPFTWIERQTAADGSTVIAEDETPYGHHWLMRVEDPQGRLHVVGPRDLYGTSYERDDFGNRDIRNEQVNLFLLTDHPVYRPGQETRWKAWMRHRDFSLSADTNRYAIGDLRVALVAPQAPNHMLESALKFNAEGAADGAVRLPASGVLGRHAIYAHGTYATNYRNFPVEQFRKPEFVVSAAVNGHSLALGDTFEFQINARYYSGPPLVGGMVRYHVSRRPQRWSGREPAYPATEWDWLYRNGHPWRDSSADEQTEWFNDQGGEVVSGLVPLRADGTAVIPVDTQSAAQLGRGASQLYSLRAWVMDATQRTVELTADHIVTPQPCTLLLDADHGFYHAGETGRLTLRSCHTDGSPAALTAILKHTAPDGSITTVPFPSGQDGQSKLNLLFQQTGLHRLVVEATLPDGRKATTQREMSVLDATTATLKGDAPDAALTIQLRNPEHAPGEDAELLITSRRADADVWLFIRAAGGVYPDPVHLRLKGHYAIQRVSVTEADFPNFFVQAFTVDEGRLVNVLRQVLVPPKHIIAKVSIETDRASYQPGDTCRVKIRTTRFDGSPLQANVAFTAYDKTLDALRNQAVDERDYLLKTDLPDIRQFFWGWRRGHGQRITSSSHASGLFDYRIPGLIENDWQGYYPWREEDDRAGACACAIDPTAEPPSGNAVRSMSVSLDDLLNRTRIRQTMRDNIAWEPDLHTNEHGEADVEFTLPDNLTTWTLRAWAVGTKTEVGEVRHDVPVTKPLELRIAAPRFLIVGDQAVLAASVTDSTQRNQPLRAVIDLQGAGLNLLDDATQNTTLDASGGSQVTWRIRAAEEGPCIIRIKAASNTAEDATEITLPVRLPQTAQLESWDVSIAPGQKERVLEFKVPKSDRPDSTRLELRLTPGALAVIADALPYLAEYPHGCAEQTLNRFLPTLIAHRTCAALKLDLNTLGKAAKMAAASGKTLPQHLQRWQRDEKHPRWNTTSLFDAEKVRDMAAAGIARLTDMAVINHRGDGTEGGWAWFGGGDRGNAQLTALIVHGFLQARLSGLQVNNHTLTAGFAALQKHEEKQYRCFSDPGYYGLKQKHLGDDLDVLVHATLVESLEQPAKLDSTDKLQALRDNHDFSKAQPSAAMRKHLISRRDHLAAISLSRLAVACHQLGENENRDQLLESLKTRVKTDAGTHTAWLDTERGSTWQQDFIETQAAFLRLLVAVEPASSLTADVARNLIVHRSQGRFWNSTRDTAASIEALAAFALSTGEADRHQTVQVLLDGKLKQQIEIHRDSVLAAVPGLVFDATDLPPGSHTLTLRLTGDGSLPATVGLQHFGRATAPPSNHLKLTRRLWRVDPSSIQANQADRHSYWWHQRSIQRELITNASPIKAGDMIEIENEFTAAQPLEYVLLESPLPAALHPIHSLSSWEYQDGLSGYQEFRNDRTCFFMERLGTGGHTLRILTRVENAGSFTLPPASITAMYAPSFQATSGTEQMTVGRQP